MKVKDATKAADTELARRLKSLLRKSTHTVEEIAGAVECTPQIVERLIRDLRAKGAMIGVKKDFDDSLGQGDVATFEAIAVAPDGAVSLVALIVGRNAAAGDAHRSTNGAIAIAARRVDRHAPHPVIARSRRSAPRRVGWDAGCCQ